MRLGLVGVGRIGAYHAETLHHLPEVDELILTDADTERAQVVAEKVGERHVPDVPALLAERLDGLVIAAPTDAHGMLICAAVENGVPVFCEKPVAATIDETLRVIETVRRLDGRVQIGFQRRFDAGYMAARQAVVSGAIGWVHTLRGGTLDPAPPPAAYIATSGGIFKDCSVHDFDIIRWMIGREVVEVYATGSNRGEPFFVEAGDVDTAAAMLRLEDDAIALVSATRYNAAGYDVRLEVLGSRNSISVGLDERLPLRSVEAGIPWPAGTAYPGFMDRFRDAYVTELKAFVDFVAGRIDNPCTVSEALEAVYVAEACELSRQEKRPVQVSEVRR